MKKIIILLLVFLFIGLLFNIPKYNELNNIVIIDKIKIDCSNDIDILLREVNPVKTDNGITYNYTYYKNNIKNINMFKSSFTNKYHKSFYYNKVKILESNCNDIDRITSSINVKPNKIKKS